MTPCYYSTPWPPLLAARHLLWTSWVLLLGYAQPYALTFLRLFINPSVARLITAT